MSSSEWIWSAEHKNYYRTIHVYGQQPAYDWYKQQLPQPQQAGTPPACYPVPEVIIRHDSGGQHNGGQAVAFMPESVAPEQARALDGFIRGTPHTGLNEVLDSSYRMRTGYEVHQFFVVGRVFSMLYTEAAGETSRLSQDRDAYTVVRLGGVVYTNIRRFIVLRGKRGFVEACAIGTYGGRGANKYGCDPSEHAPVYLSGVDPRTCDNDARMRNPIQIVPADNSITLNRESLVRFGKTYPIEMNVKVKDVGRVLTSDLSRLLRYWNEADHSV